MHGHAIAGKNGQNILAGLADHAGDFMAESQRKSDSAALAAVVGVTVADSGGAYLHEHLAAARRGIVNNLPHQRTAGTC
jgi:hypothetical protein